MGVTLTDVLLFGKAQLADVDKATLVIYRRNILRWSALGGYLDIIVKGVSPLALPDAIADSLSYVKAFGGTEQRDIPDNYLQRQFIYMMDRSYLLTDIVPTYDCKVEMDFATTSVQSGAKSYLGGRSAAYPAGLRLGTGSNDNRFVVTAFSNSAYTATTEVENNTRYKFTFNNKVATLESGGSTLFTNTFTDENANGAALVINGLNSAGTITANSEGIYLYSFKAWNGQGELVMNLVPAVQRGTVPVVGFYDTVSKTFKTATAGTFAAGGEAVPTPDYPMDIVSNNGVLKVYTNLVDSDIIRTNIDSSGTIVEFQNPSFITHTAPVIPGKTYTFDAVFVFAYYTSKPVLGSVSYDSKRTAPKETTFTVPDDPSIKYVAFRNANESSVLVEGDTISNLNKVYTDGTVETIEDTIGNTATAEMLLKVGDYTDEQEIISGAVTRKVGIKVLDGTENWFYSSGWSDTTHKCFYVTPLDDIKQQTNTTNECLCSHFEWYSRDDLYADKTIIGGCISGYIITNPDSGRALTLRVSSGIATDETMFKSWLADQYAAGTPVIVVYPLATPTTESVTGQALQVQDGDNVLEITQASLNGLELEAEYQAAVSLTIQEVQDANLDPNVEVTIN